MVLATIVSSNLVNVEWILGHVGLEGNTEADIEAKRGTTLPQSSAPMDFISACAATKWHQQSVADDRYHSDPHARIHRVLAGSVNQFQRWQRNWARDQCVTVAQLHTGHSLFWQDICTELGAGTLPSVHTATMLTIQQSIWCYSVQLTNGERERERERER